MDPVHADSLVRQFLQFATAHAFAVPAYCLMADHLHALVAGRTADADLRRFVCRFKQRTGFEWKQRTGKRLWQEGYYDRVLRSEESSLSVIAYIADNPVSAGVAGSIAEYRYFGSSEQSTAQLVAMLEEWRRERGTDAWMWRVPF